MITSSTLTAFAPAVGPAAPPPGTSQATRVAAANPAARADTAQTQPKPLQALPPGAAPTRHTPRGSLLDLSV